MSRVNIGEYISQEKVEDVSVEGINDNLEEIEYDFYCRIEDFDQLAGASRKEIQEQWNLPFSKKSVDVSVRVRKCATDSDIRFELTNKIDIEGLDGVWEVERAIERQHFETIRDLSKQGMIKHRYFFPVNGTDLVWEVDVFHDDKGRPIEWVKIDLEVHQRMNKLPELPIEGFDWIMAQKGERTPEEEDFICKLYTNRFIVRKTEA